MAQHAYADENTVIATCGDNYRLSLSSLPSTPITTPPSSPRQQIFHRFICQKDVKQQKEGN
eukprot:10006741-Ditylum_brightwellii.AAC.1